MNHPKNVTGKVHKGTIKSSDRRLASGRQPEKFLHNKIQVAPTEVTRVLNSSKSSSNISEGATVKRKAGGKVWEDKSLLEWDPSHFRMFVGNLGSDANEKLLIAAFGKYKSLSKVKVPMDSRTGKNKGYGFVAFADANDYLTAYKEMNGKYVGQHPVQLKRAETAIKKTKSKRNRK